MKREPSPPERLEQYRREFAEFAELAYFIAIRRTLREDGTPPPDHRNAIGNAIGIAWKHYPRLRDKFTERPPRAVVALAVRRGVSRVKRGEQLGRELPYRGYRDALGPRPRALPDAVEQLPTIQPDPRPAAWLEDTVRQLPPRLRLAAQALAAGISKRKCAILLRVSEYRLAQLVDELRRELSRILPACELVVS